MKKAETEIRDAIVLCPQKARSPKPRIEKKVRPAAGIREVP